MVPIMAIQLTNSALNQSDQLEVQRICDCIYKLRSIGLDLYEYTYIKTLSLYQSASKPNWKLYSSAERIHSFYPLFIAKSLINQSHIDACQEHVLFLLRTSLMSHSASTYSVKFTQLIGIIQTMNHISAHAVQRIFFPSITYNIPVGKVLCELYRSKTNETPS